MPFSLEFRKTTLPSDISGCSLCFCRLNYRVICSSLQVNCWKCGAEFVHSRPFKFWLVLVFTTFCYAQCNDSLRSSHQQLHLLFAYQQYKLAPITHKLWFKQHMLHIWSIVCMNGEMVNCMYEWRERLHISQPTIFLFFKKLTGPGCLLVTSILQNIWRVFSLLSRGNSFSFYVRKSTGRTYFQHLNQWRNKCIYTAFNWQLWDKMFCYGTVV